MLHLRRPVGAIVGRTDEIRGLVAQLDGARLLSLVGAGGVGKTALAAELAHELEPEVDRLVTVELVDAEHPDDPLRLLATAVLGERSDDPAILAAGLDAERTLVIIDNCEHLIDEVAELVADQLARTVDLTVLATSRRPLGLGAETVWTVAPLAAPDDSTSDDELEHIPAVQLFLERAYRAARTFELTPANRPHVAAICRLADGVPLVLELAAALIRTTSPEEIVRAMTEPSANLASARRDLPRHQRSIEASLDWSRRFLAEDDRQLLDRLSVFVGGFTAAGAAAIDHRASPAALSRLCDHSLLGFDPTTGRHRMIEIVRVDAASRLDRAEADEVADQHLAWCLSVVEALAAARYAADPDNRFPGFELELPNLCTALRRCLQQGDLERGRALLGPIALWWVHYLPPADPAEWAELFEAENAPVASRANAISALSYLASHRGDHEAALALALRARVLHAEADDRVGETLIVTAIGNALVELGRRDEAAAAYENALAVAVASGHPYAEMTALTILARFAPEAEEAEANLDRAATLAGGGYGAIEAIIWAEQGLRALRAGAIERAAERCQLALDRARTTGYPEAVATALCGRADVAAAAGDSDLAESLYLEAGRIGRRVAQQSLIERASMSLAGLPSGGSSQTGTGPTRVARSVGSGSGQATESGEALSERELAVARLLRGDLTQREIADELYIAPSTVKTHITSIYRKLAVSKRSHAITRASELGLFDR